VVNLIVKMAMSLDGFVGGPNCEADWLFRSSDEESTAHGRARISTLVIM
jgi:riboflavin biosynthesis pyrimidine reductase